MPKKKSKSPEEYYKGEIRKLRKEVQQLRRQLEKDTYKSQDEEFHNDTEDTFRTLKPVRKCPDCSKSDLREFEIVGRTYETCDLCGYRRKKND